MSTVSVGRASVLDQYERDGYSIFRNVIDADLIAEASAHVDWLAKRHPDVRTEQLGHIYLRDDPFWIRLISDDRLLDIAEMFIGPNIALFASHYISKPPFTGQTVLWHQDSAFWPLEPMEVVTLWLAVDHSTPENGCVRVVPGSHTREIAAMRPNTEVDNVLGHEIACDVDEADAVDIVLRPGDVEVHHPNIIHGSNANVSPHRRCGLTLRYIPTSTRILGEEQPYPSALWLRGDLGVNSYQPVPVFDPARHFPFRDSAAWS
ncbi:phytanoyl-CoA dioxygenase family protein [Micromonospora inositola]|uniref:Ectoine hydroxylase-related dioxygenase, phytanoyl-CoA dioxygenase (PhyH) family n=1 Tax=Micromonospora inositola TaxID=47865 RepID=A0A1C5JY79_9ACTN|nr:phytanoyl-CoA dioxygenase family protein [Micromonospora inositola]SCG74986.1 Ectoine hydroxylase-related dioxygenase, phytanoyl-CoA dioxygenase (PhyH) family [Micromonospora inositola]